MKWMLDRIRQLIAAYSQKRALGHEPIKPDDPYQTDLAPSSEPQSSSKHVGANFILSRLRVSRKACEAIIMNARTKAGWFK
jgi:hypothetical protein